TERQLAGEAHQDVPCLADVGEVEDQDQDAQPVLAEQRRRHEQQPEQDGEAPQEARRRVAGETADKTHCEPLPKSPCGRSSRTRMRSPKLNMLLSDGCSSRPATASLTPISRPPIKAPVMLPSPPTITMTKGSRVYSAARKGRPGIVVIMSAPAAPTQAAPTPKVMA